MIPLYSDKKFKSAKSIEKLPLKCEECENTFYKEKRKIQSALKGNSWGFKANFCSRKCLSLYNKKRKIIKCKNCNKTFEKELKEIKKTKNNFCSKSCAATYNNTHKKHGTRRSKLEVWLEKQLTQLYPNLKIHFNRKDTINSELDIYIPSLSLAFELNGIFHYEPIYGQEKLAQIQNNDDRKYQACIEYNIELCILDVSQMKYFKKQKGEKYLDIITNIINSKLSTS